MKIKIMNNKRGDLEEPVKLLIKAAFFALIVIAVYFIIKSLKGSFG